MAVLQRQSSSNTPVLDFNVCGRQILLTPARSPTAAAEATWPALAAPPAGPPRTLSGRRTRSWQQREQQQHVQLEQQHPQLQQPGHHAAVPHLVLYPPNVDPRMWQQPPTLHIASDAGSTPPTATGQQQQEPAHTPLQRQYIPHVHQPSSHDHQQRDIQGATLSSLLHSGGHSFNNGSAPGALQDGVLSRTWHAAPLSAAASLTPHQQHAEQPHELPAASSLSTPAASLRRGSSAASAGDVVRTMPRRESGAQGSAEGAPGGEGGRRGSQVLVGLAVGPAGGGSLRSPSPGKKRASPAGAGRQAVAYLKLKDGGPPGGGGGGGGSAGPGISGTALGGTAGGGAGGESTAAAAAALEQARRAQERLEMHRQAREAQAARQATEEAQARQQRMEAVQRLAAEKERRRCNVYAMNAILRMCDEAMVAQMMAQRAGQAAATPAAAGSEEVFNGV